jgi:hypothetical protein
MWHIDPLIGNKRETKNETTAVARHRPARHNGSTVGSDFLRGLLLGCITRQTEISSIGECSVVEYSGVK